MSLLFSVAFDHFVVVASDGLASQLRHGKLVPIGHDYCKFWTVTNDIALGSTGSVEIQRAIQTFSTNIVEQHRNDPELFSILARTVPDEVRRLNQTHPHRRLEYAVGTEKMNIAGANLLLAGYDQDQKKMRCESWLPEKDGSDLTFHDCNGMKWGMGYTPAIKFVLEQLARLDAFLLLDPDAVAEAVTTAIEKASERFPEWIGGEIYSHVILPLPTSL